MLYEACIYQMCVENHTFWVAESKCLKGCVGQGESSTEAIKELEENEKEWLETAQKFGISIPPISSKSPFSHNGKVSLRLSPDIHTEAASNAAELGISLNQYINNAVVAYNFTSKKFLRPYVSSNQTENIIEFPFKAPRNASITLESDNLEEM